MGRAKSLMTCVKLLPLRLPIIGMVCLPTCECDRFLRPSYTAEINAIQRCLSESQFFDEYPGPETQVISIRHQAHASNPHNLARRCHLTLQLAISSKTPEDPLIISEVHWSATDSPLAFPSPFNPFQHLSNVHFGFPLPVSRDRNCSSWSLDRQGQGSLAVTISDGEVTFSESVNCVPTTNRLTISSTHRSVIVNYIKGDIFLGPISGGNVGGTNNTDNSACSISHTLIHSRTYFNWF